MSVVDASESSEIVNAASDFHVDGDDATQSEGSVVESNVVNEEFSPTKEEMTNQMLAHGEVVQSNFTAQHNGRNLDLVLRDSAEIMWLFLNASGSGAGAVVIKEENEMRKVRKRQSKYQSSRKAKLQKTCRNQNYSICLKNGLSELKKSCKPILNEEVWQLQAVVKELKAESSKLDAELLSLCNKCCKLREENDSLVEELKQIYGADAVSSLDALMSNTK